ncbi:MAG: YesL family protein [Clostridia bacterium]|nr:YesL family protein [Clostridia bacterium]
MKNEKNKKKRLRIFDFTRDGRGVSKNATGAAPGSLRHFFFCLKNNFGKLVSANIFFILGNFPLFFAITAFSGYTKVERMIPLSDLFQNLFGLMSAQPTSTPAQMSMFAVEGMQYQTLAPTTLTYIFYGIGLLTLFTFGIVNVGTAYILRNMVKGEPIFVWTDFWYAVKRNLKQAMIFGFIDAAICALLIYNIYSMVYNTGTFLLSLVFWANVVLFLLFFFMRYYIYVQMVTFDLSIFKMVKNALYFSLLGIKRNIMALLGILVGLLLEVLCLFGAGGFLVPVAVAAPLAILVSLFAFMKVYASYFKIKQYMIDPYLAEHPEEAPVAEDDEAPIMTDDVTERERLDEIKKRNGLV